MDEPVAHHLRQRPHEHRRHARAPAPPPPPRRSRPTAPRSSGRSTKPLQIMLLAPPDSPAAPRRRDPARGRRACRPPPPSRNPPAAAHRTPGYAQPDRHVRALRLGRRAVEHRRQIRRADASRTPAPPPSRAARQRRRRRRQHAPAGRASRVCAASSAPRTLGDRHRRERRHRRRVVQARPPVGHHPPPRLADLELRRQPRRRPRSPRTPPRPRCRYPIAPSCAGRQQVDGGTHPVSAGDAVRRPLLPVAPAMRVEQLVATATRSPHSRAPSPAPRSPGATPRTRTFSAPPASARRNSPPTRLEPEIMAHPDIMVDRPAIAELQRVAQHPRRRQVIAVVIAARDPQPVLAAPPRRRSPAPSPARSQRDRRSARPTPSAGAASGRVAARS